MGQSGKDCKGFVNTGTFASKTWVEIRRGTEFKIPQSRGSSDFRMRGNVGVVTTVGYIARSVTFKYHRKAPGQTDTVFAALQTAFLAGANIECAFMDRPIATVGATGVAGFFVITKFDRNEDDEDNVNVDVEMKPADHEESGTPVEVAPFTTPT
jgi:hypothetical protein